MRILGLEKTALREICDSGTVGDPLLKPKRIIAGITENPANQFFFILMQTSVCIL